MRRLLIALSCTALLGGVVAFLTGTISLVETHGNSMAPRMSAGDLVFVHASSTYRVGDVVAYTSPELDQVVLHRVVSIDDGRYTFRGDHNSFDDPERPTEQQFIGKELLRVPAGGTWMDRLTSPIALGMVAFAVLAAGGTAVGPRRRGTKRTRKTPMSQHAAPTRAARTASSWPPRWRTAMAVAAATLCVGLALGVMSWTRPTASSASTATTADETERAVTFSYQADVPLSPAYDDTRVTAPDPIFRKLTDQVNIRYAYRGAPGTVSVAGKLSTPSGWHSTVPLQPRVTFTEPEHTATVGLDLHRLERQAHAAADAIGIPATQIDIAIVPTITTEDGDTFAPELHFALTPLQLSLVGGPATLEAVDPTTTRPPASAQGTFQLAGHELPVAHVRALSVALIVGPLALLCLVGLIATRRTASESAAIKRRYASILLPVEPMTSPPGRPIVDVTDFTALSKLSERYGLMIMHWTRANIDTFTVHDDGITYRYRTGDPNPTEPDHSHTNVTMASAAAVAPAAGTRS